MSGYRLSVADCARLIEAAENVVVFTGAGISTAAGIPDFRGPQGLYVTRAYDPDKVFNIEYFARDPELFYDFTREFLAVVEAIVPTFTHRFFAALEERGKVKAVVTQNIDPLHDKAGSKTVLPVHGDYWTSHCRACGKKFTYIELVSMIRKMGVPRCRCDGVIKPDVVFFGEPVRDFDRAAEAVASSDLLFVLGSSLTVYPAASLPGYARKDVVVVNKGPIATAPNGAFVVDADLDYYFRGVAESMGADE